MESRSPSVRRAAPALADDVIDGTPEHGPRGLEPPVLRSWQPVGQAERPEALADVLIDDGPGIVDRGRERTEVGAQEGTEHDGARETHHLFGDIRRLSARRDRLPPGRGVSVPRRP